MGLSNTIDQAITTTTLRGIAADKKTDVSGFWLAHDLAHKTNNNELARHVYRCAYGINELLLSSFKLHKNEKDLVIDPWEVILTELAFLFEAPMVVGRVNRRHRKGGPEHYIRTNVRNAEYKFIAGQERSTCKLFDSAVIGVELRDRLLNFFREHAAAAPGSDPPLALVDYPGTGNFRAAFEKEAARYDELLVELRQADAARKHEIYEGQFNVQNPELLKINGVVAMALYYVRRETSDPPVFVGTIELYLPEPERLPLTFRQEELSMVISHIALMLSLVSTSGLCLNGPDGDEDDFDSYSRSPTVDLSEMPSFHEYGKDLKEYIKKVMNGAGVYDDSMETESSLPAVFNDLYLQMKRLFRREGYGEKDAQIAFVVPKHPDGDGNSVGRYYFPSKFIDELFTDEVLGDAQKSKDIKNALEVLMVSGQTGSDGLPLDLGLLGYVKKTLFPAFTYDIHRDARAQSYNNTQQLLELELFSAQSTDISVIEFPLVLFWDNEKGRVYPTYLIAFLSKRRRGDQPRRSSQLLSYRGRHQLYALVYHARYSLAKAFAAEVFREKQVDQLSIVVHDMDRMNRLFTANIVKMARLVEAVNQGASAFTEEQRRELNDLQGSAVVISDYLQFSQYLTDKKRSFPGIVSEGVLSEKISLFQSMFSSVNKSSGKWPGWSEPTVRLDPRERRYRADKDSDGKNRLDETRCKFKWPQGALTGTLWNLSANAYTVYMSDNWGEQMRGELPSITCNVGRLSPLGIATATFTIRFPGINFRIGKETKPGEVCRAPEREGCSRCPHEGACAPRDYAHKLFTFTGPVEGRGMRSCQQAIKAWAALMTTEAEGSFSFDKAGLPEVIKFIVPIEYKGKSDG